MGRIICAVVVIAICLVLAAKGDLVAALVLAGGYAFGFACGTASAHHNLGLL